MGKRIKKKIKIKLMPFVIVIFSVAVLYILYMLLVSLPIKNIYISGNSILTDQEIIDLAGLRDYPSFLKTTGKKIRSAIKSNNYIIDVNVEKSFFGIVSIDIDEAKALFINLDGKLVLSNLEAVDNDKKISTASLINYVPDVKYNVLVEKLAKVNDSIRSKVSEIMYEPTEQDKDRFGLYMDDGNLVYVTLTKFEMIDYYDSIISEVGCKKGILNLDSGNHFEIKNDSCK